MKIYYSNWIITWVTLEVVTTEDVRNNVLFLVLHRVFWE